MHSPFPAHRFIDVMQQRKRRIPIVLRLAGLLLAATAAGCTSLPGMVQSYVFDRAALDSRSASSPEAAFAPPGAPCPVQTQDGVRAPNTGSCTDGGGGGACNPHFWIVSSRRCPQSGDECPDCRFDQFVYHNGTCYPQTDPGAFQKWLIPDAPIAVVVHGSFTSFKALLGESCELHRWLHAGAPNRPLNVVVYTWPSDDYPTNFFPIDVNLLGRSSAYNGFYLSRFLDQVPRGSRVSLIGHSHGARTVASALHLRSGGAVQGRRLCNPQPCSHRLRAVFLAAAIDHNWLNPGSRYGLALCSLEALLNLRNACDLPLAFYPLRRPFSRRALARTGFKSSDLDRIGSAASKVAELDVTPMLGRHHMWVYYFRELGLAMQVAPYVFFTDDEPAPGPAPPANVPPTPTQSRGFVPANPARSKTLR